MPFIKKVPFNQKKICKDSEHDPPKHIVLQPGTYTWQCPSCKQTQTFTVPLKTL